MKLGKFTVAAFALLLFSVSGWASDKMKANIEITQTVQVGSTQLVPGKYKMTWTESNSNAEVTFSQGKKVIATVPAQLTQEHSGYEGPALRFVGSTLVGVDLPEVSLTFAGGSAAPASQGN